MEKHRFSGRTLDDALAAAQRHFSVDKSFISYNSVDTQSSGFFSKLFAPKVHIEAWVGAVKEDLEQAARDAVHEALRIPTKSTPAPSQDMQGLLKQYNTLFFGMFGLNEKDYPVTWKESGIEVHVTDEFLEEFLEKSDKLALAYEHVFKRIAQRHNHDISFRLLLNVGVATQKREERLIGIARSLAAKVQKTGKQVVLSSKSSAERKIIHMALDGMEGIKTRSVGTGDRRQLVIFSSAPASHDNSNPYKGRHREKDPRKAQKRAHPSRTKT